MIALGKYGNYPGGFRYGVMTRQARGSAAETSLCFVELTFLVCIWIILLMNFRSETMPCP